MRLRNAMPAPCGISGRAGTTPRLPAASPQPKGRLAPPAAPVQHAARARPGPTRCRVGALPPKSHRAARPFPCPILRNAMTGPRGGATALQPPGRLAPLLGPSRPPLRSPRLRAAERRVSRPPHTNLYCSLLRRAAPAPESRTSGGASCAAARLRPPMQAGAACALARRSPRPRHQPRTAPGQPLGLPSACPAPLLLRPYKTVCVSPILKPALRDLPRPAAPNPSGAGRAAGAPTRRVRARRPRPVQLPPRLASAPRRAPAGAIDITCNTELHWRPAPAAVQWQWPRSGAAGAKRRRAAGMATRCHACGRPPLATRVPRRCTRSGWFLAPCTSFLAALASAAHGPESPAVARTARRGRGVGVGARFSNVSAINEQREQREPEKRVSVAATVQLRAPAA
jgi:hypothetical protein